MSSTKYSNPAVSVALNDQYLNESTADIFFVFETDDGECERVPCHKFLLAACSEVFCAMFNGSWQENENGDVKIIDSSAAAFKEFLRFFYFDEVELTTDTAEEIFCLGQKYLVKTCVDVCVRHLSDNLTPDNVCSVYALSTFYDKKELKKWCELVIGTNPTAVFKSIGFLECDQQIVSQILKLDTLLCPEIKVFKASMAWLRAASNRKTIDKELVQEYLGESFKDIRFGLMTGKQVNGISTSHKNLFSAAERKEIIRVVRSNRVFKSKKSKTVSKEPRNKACDEKNRLKCIRKTHKEGRLYSLSDDSTTFTTNAPLLLRALVFGEILVHHGYVRHSKTKIDEDINAKLTIIEFRDGVCSMSNSRTVYADSEVCLNPSGGRCNVVNLSKPVIIKPGYTYRILYNLLSPFDGRPLGIAFGISSNRVQLQNGTEVEFSNDSKRNGQARGLLYGLNFNPI